MGTQNQIINAHYLQIRKIEEHMQQQDKIKMLMQEMKKSLSHEVFKKIKA